MWVSFLHAVAPSFQQRTSTLFSGSLDPEQSSTLEFLHSRSGALIGTQGSGTVDIRGFGGADLH